MATFRPHFILLLLLLCIITFTQSTPLFLGKYAKKPNKLSSYKYKTQYFTQQLDHFSFQDSGNFSQRYLINADNWVGAQRKGPIFMYCGNEGDIEWFASNSGFIWEIAPRFGAMLLFPEHRYYGESMPYGSKEEAYKNSTTLSYLTAEQAIADYAVLLRELKQNLSAEGCPVVLFGGSYGGMLAAWMRLKYPHLTVGALASSAPILQFEDIVPPETFYNIVSNDFRRESINCFNTIKESWGELQSMGENTDGLNQLTKTFHLCGELKNTQDLSDWLSSAYSYLAMVDYPYPSDFLMPLPGHPIREVCKRIDSAADGTSVLDRIFYGVSIYYNFTGAVNCFKLDDDPHGMSGWQWQACTEMVMPMSSDPEKSMFPIFNFNKTYEEERCIRSYGVKPRFRWITTEFGGHSDGHYSKLPFSVLQNVSESLVALVTEEGAHHLDLRASTPNDPDWLVQQRVSEIRLIKGWIDDYNQGKGSAFSM
uniref:Lysosomal Pro-X carboxypeptidase n=1 Tax=Chenopodium quinoa TaxID=63459 RepID=A0A803L7Y7_CHEQI